MASGVIAIKRRRQIRARAAVIPVWRMQKRGAKDRRRESNASLGEENNMPPKTKKLVKKTAGLRRRLRGGGQVCQDPISPYTKKISIRYKQNQEECSAPTADEEGKAMKEAKQQFMDAAAAYCKTGSCTEPHRTCTATVTELKVTNDGTESAPVAGNRKDCYIKFTVSGNISCFCPEKES